MTTILHKRGTGIPPADQLKAGELAIDTLGGKLYTKQSDGTVVEIGGGISTVSGNQNIDGGNATSVYTLDQVIDGGSA
jgi:hypothetical protein